MILSWSLFNRLDISIPFYTGGPVLMVPWPGEESRLLATIRPFQLTVHIMIFYNELLRDLDNNNTGLVDTFCHAGNDAIHFHGITSNLRQIRCII